MTSSRGRPGAPPVAVVILLAGAVAAACLLAWLVVSPPNSAGTGWEDGFDRGSLDPAAWEATESGDFRERAADVLDARLRLRADTSGTRDDTVKFLGVRSRRSVRLSRGARVAVTLDWNGQANGSYLSAGLVIAAAGTRGNPLETGDWLQVEYVGVPPGRKARMVVAACQGGRRRTLFGEGWPETNRAGRPIGAQAVEVRVQEQGFSVRENGEEVYRSPGDALGFREGFLYLQMSSHSNFPAREVYFDDVWVSDGR